MWSLHLSSVTLFILDNPREGEFTTVYSLSQNRTIPTKLHSLERGNVAQRSLGVHTGTGFDPQQEGANNKTSGTKLNVTLTFESFGCGRRWSGKDWLYEYVECSQIFLINCVHESLYFSNVCEYYSFWIVYTSVMFLYISNKIIIVFLSLLVLSLQALRIVSIRFWELKFWSLGGNTAQGLTLPFL